MLPTLFLTASLTSSVSVLGTAVLMRKAPRLEMETLSMAVPETMRTTPTGSSEGCDGDYVAVADCRDRCEGPPEGVAQIPYPFLESGHRTRQMYALKVPRRPQPPRRRGDPSHPTLQQQNT